MTITIADAEDAYLEAQAEIEEWQEEFEREWFAPLSDTLIAAALASLPEEVKAQLRAMLPDAMAQLEKQKGWLPYGNQL